MLINILLHTVLAFANKQYNTYNASTYDVCQTEYTMQHYQNGSCVEVVRPVSASNKETFKLRAVVLSKKETGSENYPAMVMIPGGPGESSGMLRYVLNEKDVLNGILKYLDHRVVMYDPRGTGTSLLPKAAHKYDKSVFSQQQMVDDLVALIDAVSPNKPVVLFAHSAGGGTALKMASLRPDRVSKIILASTSVSPRAMGELNLATYAKEPLLWKNYLKTAPGSANELAQLNKEYLFIEDILVQQFKAKAIKKYIHPGVKQYPMIFRNLVTVAINNDASGAKVAELIHSTYQKLVDLEMSSGQALVPKELRLEKVSDDSNPDRFQNGEWIKVAVMCGEGMTAQDVEKDSLFDGLKMSWYCNGFSTNTPEDIDLTKIKTPVLFITGLQDSIIPLSEAQRVVSLLPNAELVISEKGGHAVFYDEPSKFFFPVEKFLK